MGQKAFWHSLGTSFTLDLSTGSQDQRFGRHSDDDTDGARARSGERRAWREPYRVVGRISTLYEHERMQATMPVCGIGRTRWSPAP